LAGRKSNGNTASVKKMIENLPGSASRYVYPAVERYVPTLNNDIIKIIDKYSSAKNVELAKNPKGL
jgi:septum formation topological specificity factor MinE